MAKTNWTTDNMPDQTGKVAVVTGANSGIGFEAARTLAAKGAQVVMACRSLEKGQAALDKISRDHPNAQVELLPLDLASLDSVRAFAGAFLPQYTQLDLLINNAGAMALPDRRETADGFETQFGVNHLGHFALTGHLFDLILQTPGARIVNVSSSAHRMGKVEWDNLNAERKYGRWSAYGLSKLANLLFTYELQRKLTAVGVDVIATAAHPGYTATDLQRYNTGVFNILNPIMAQDAPTGALPTLRAATDPAVVGGEYYGPSGFMEIRGHPVQVTSNKASHDAADAARLWTESEKMTGVTYTALKN